MRPFIIACLFALAVSAAAQTPYHEQYRPQIHFTPPAHWMNDPNGLVFFDGEYHLFYQYFPGAMVWGPMHWGHAVSTDLLHWQNLPVALTPDSNGYIFSGSAVVDSANTSGFGADGKIPLVAIYARHDPQGEKQGRNDFQSQCIAYSLDKGRTWTKYEHNPVLASPGLKDFRDPKLMWLADQHKWLMTLAAHDRIMFFSSPDLKTWTKESEFGSGAGAHGGVWECPDLFSLNFQNRKVWVLLVSINPGGLRGGSGTQYFTGDFDGHRFIPTDTTTHWIDFGADNYAGVTFSNTGNRRIFLGWMSNWAYAQAAPTNPWRSAMTLPREVGLQLLNGKYVLTMFPVYELHKLDNRTAANVDVPVEKITKYAIPAKTGAFRIDLSSDQAKSFSMIFTDRSGQELVVGYESNFNAFFVDRTRAGQDDFNAGFAARHSVPRATTRSRITLTVVVDQCSVELFGDDGLTVVTDLVFPKQPYGIFTMKTDEGFIANSLRITDLKSVW